MTSETHSDASPNEPSEAELTALLDNLRAGDPDASEGVLRRLYDVLRAIARDTMAFERRDHTLQPTALVHEAWMRVFHAGKAPAIEFQDRDHLIRLVARTMRRVLVDHSRAKGAAKRGGRQSEVELDDAVAHFDARGTNLVEFDDALSVLAQTDEELARVVELKTFGGLSMEDIAAALGVSLATAERRWRVAKIWMLDALGG